MCTLLGLEKRYMSLIIAYWIVVGLLLGTASVQAQPATVSGSVVLPAGINDKKRSFRGSQYRSRQTPSSRRKEPQKRDESPFRAVVISAHPTSFTPEVKPLAEPIGIEQVGVAFAPRVTPITVGTTVEFINNDAIYHNVFSLTSGAKFNVGRHPTGKIVPKQIEHLGVIDLFCDIHPQMHGAILSLDTPYYTGVDDGGNFELGDLPAGTYELRAFYPGLDTVTAEIDLQAGETKTWFFHLDH